MSQDLTRNLRLVVATLLLSLWGYSHLARTPMLGDTLLPLVLSLVIAPGSPFLEWRGSKSRIRMALALVFLLAVTWLLYSFGTQGELVEFTHTPWLVAPVWLAGLVGLARNATSAERIEARAAAAPAQSTDVDWSAVESQSAGHAPASLSVRKRS